MSKPTDTPHTVPLEWMRDLAYKHAQKFVENTEESIDILHFEMLKQQFYVAITEAARHSPGWVKIDPSKKETWDLNCPHPSLDGIDKTDGVDKVWRCTMCEGLYYCVQIPGTPFVKYLPAPAPPTEGETR